MTDFGADNKLAWSMTPISGEKRITVDLDKEQNRAPGKKPNIHRIIIRQTNRVRMDVLIAWLSRQTSFGNACIEGKWLGASC